MMRNTANSIWRERERKRERGRVGGGEREREREREEGREGERIKAQSHISLE